MKKNIFIFSLIGQVFLFSTLFAATERPIIVGSKKFTESVVLGEIIRLTLDHHKIVARHKKELGGTRLLWNAMLAGDIDVYPEYTGTITEEILQKKVESLEQINSELAKFGIGALPPLGFNNTYAIGMKQNLAHKLLIKNISDLSGHPELKLGWGEEFLQRQDGWPGLKKRYQLPHRFVRGLDHDIGYRALETGDIQIMDLYSTDAEIAYYDLLVLKDNLNYFPRYDALILYRLDQAEKNPEIFKSLKTLSGQISENEMVELNRQAKIDKIPPQKLAANFLNQKFAWGVEFKSANRRERILLRSKEHLMLVFLSLFFAILVAIPLGIMAAKMPLLGRGILGVVGIIQTIPALALLVVLIRPLNLLGLSGIGDTPALVSLFLYSLLPIVRSTHSGLKQISPILKDTAEVMGLSFMTKLFRIELPLALPSILSGIKISAVMNVGFATLGALVGAGGYGQPILTGIRLDNYGLILEGAIPAAILAILAQYFFDYCEKSFLVSPGLK